MKFRLTVLRFIYFRVYRYIKNRQKDRRKGNRIKKILLFPSFKSKDDLICEVKKLNFAIPRKENITFFFRSNNSEAIDYFRRNKFLEFNTESRHELDNISLVILEQDNPVTYSDYDLILCHRVSRLFCLVNYFYKTEIIDKYFYSYLEGLNFQKLYNLIVSTERRNQLKNNSRDNFNRLIQTHQLKKNAYCFLTGPSIGLHPEFIIHEQSVKIICNSLVKNHEFNHFISGPDIITFADPIFHFGASDYAVQFRKHMFDLAMKYNSYIIVPSFTVPLLLGWFPKLEKLVIGFDTIDSEFINLPDINNMWVKATDNIFTMFILPLAYSLADNIYIAGADGREKNETYFWKFDVTSQFTEEMNSVFESHPSFFRDRNYTSYYEKHCKNVEIFINYAAKIGKNISSLTPSYIPSLKTK